LSGFHPRYTNSHPSPTFHRKVDKQLKAAGDSGDGSGWLVDADLRALSNGLEGRSNNPIALLSDHLTLPFVDMGYRESGSVVTEFRPTAALKTVLIGDQAGGSWSAFAASTMTLSPGSWMGLAGFPLDRWLEGQQQKGTHRGELFGGPTNITLGN
jgi:hypothetical protein